MTNTNQHSKATQFLDNPLQYPGLPEKKFPRVLLRIWRYPAFEPYCSWAVIEEKKQYFLRRIVWDQLSRVQSPDPEMYGAETLIEKSIVDELMGQLQQIKLPAFIPVNTIGLDGVTNGVEVGDYTASARLSWWGEPPAEWAGLRLWHDKAVKVFEGLVPVCTAGLHTR